MGDRWRRLAVAMMIVAGAVPLIASAAPAATGATAPAATAGTRAMWLWSSAPSGEVASWAAANGVQEIMAYVAPEPGAADLHRLTHLAGLAGGAGIRLSALGGDPSWTFDHTAALAWQRRAVATGLFSAVHVDVEPYALTRWETDRGRTARAYLSLLDKLRSASNLPLEADVPFWYDTVTVSGRNFATEVVRRVDAVTVMSYRDTATGPNSVLDVGADMLARGALAGRPVRLAVETGKLDDCPHCTFAGEDRAALDTALAAVDAAAAQYPAFAGVAVHHYDSWRAMTA